MVRTRPCHFLYWNYFYSSDLEVNSSQEGSVQQLSTFRPTKDNVIRETLDEWTIRLNETDVRILAWHRKSFFAS